MSGEFDIAGLGEKKKAAVGGPAETGIPPLDGPVKDGASSS
jgi:hypothetical protein